jgi:hypothetical protein
VKWSLVVAFALLAGCRPEPKALVDPELAAYLPQASVVIAGIDLNRLRTTPFFAKIPEGFREGSYTVVGFTGNDIITVSRVGSRVAVTGPAVKGSPPELFRHASDAPIWIVARGDAVLPFTGNLTNITRLLQQTEYTTVTGRVGDRVELAIEGVCRTAEGAGHLEDNVRAIASLMRLPLEVRREGVKVHVIASMTADDAAKLF